MRKNTIVIVVFLLSCTVFSQNTMGKISYRATMVGLDSTKGKQGTPREKRVFKEVMATIKAVEKLKLELSFTDNESNFFIDDLLVADNESEFLYAMAKNIANVRNDFYYSKKENKLVERKDVFGEVYLVSKNVNVNDWELLNETKSLGNYLCYKAVRELELISGRGKPFVRKQEVWYTPQIPLPYGPKDFVGFPGLVLQVTSGTVQYTATKIVLNPKERIKIKKPKRGKKITKKEYKKITAKSLENSKAIYKN